MRGGFAKDGIAASWLLVRRRTTRGFRTAVFDRLAASFTPRLRTTIPVRARATIAIHPGSTVSVRTRPAITFTGAANLITIAGSGWAAEITFGWPAGIATFAADVGSTLWLESGTLTEIGDHHAEALHGLLGQLIPHPGKRAGAGQGDIRL